MMGFGIVIPVLPFFALELGASSLDIGLLVTVWAAAQFLTTPRWGAFSDRIGRRPAILIGLLGVGFAFIAMGLATELWMLYAARVTGGLLSASTMPSAKAYIADVSTPEERGPSMGLIGAAFGLGFVLGPAIGGLLAPLGIRLTFFIAGSLGFVTAIPVFFFLPEPKTRDRSATEMSLLTALRTAAGKSHAILYWIPFAMTFAGISLFTMLGYYLIDRFGASETVVGLAFAVNGAVGVITQGFLIGPATFRFSEVGTLRLAMVIAGAGYLLLPLAPSVPVLLLCVVLASLGMSLARPVVTSLLSKATDMTQGVTMGIQTSYDSMGRMLGPAWAGAIYAVSMHAPYLSSAIIYFVCFFFLQQARQQLEAAEGTTLIVPSTTHVASRPDD